MEKRRIIKVLMLPVIAACFFSCIDNKNKQAFDAAVQSRTLSELRQFLIQYPEADSLLVDSAKIILAEWERDSADFAELKLKEDVVERVGLEQSYMDQHPEGLYLDSVLLMFQNDESIAASIIERQEAIRQHLDSYRKKFVNYAFYADPYHCILLTEPDENGKGIGTLFDGILTYYDFRYSINIEDLEDKDILCNYIVDDKNFTLSLYEKTLYYSAQGNSESFDGELNEKFYKDFLERVAKIKKGEKVYGNPTVTISIGN